MALARPVARRRGPLRIVGGRRRFSARNAPSRLRSAPPPTSLVACSATPAPDPGCTYASASRRLTRSAPRCAPAAIYRRSTGTVHMRQYGHTSRMHSSPPRAHDYCARPQLARCCSARSATRPREQQQRWRLAALAPCRSDRPSGCERPSCQSSSDDSALLSVDDTPLRNFAPRTAGYRRKQYPCTA